jgi:tetratricopeptide (TPR) repeat protein
MSTAKELLKKAKELENQGDKKTASSHFQKLAKVLIKEKKYSAASKALRHAMSLTPDSARLYLSLAACESESGHMTESRQWMGQFARMLLRKGGVEKYQTLVEEELAKYPRLRRYYYEAMLTLDRTSVTPFIHLAECDRQARDFSNARKVLLQALKVQAKSPEIVKLLETVLKESNEEDLIVYLEDYVAGKLSEERLVALLSPKPKPKQKKEIPKEKVKIVYEEEGPNIDEIINELAEELDLELEIKYDQVAPLVEEFRRRSQPTLSGHSKTRLDLALAFSEMGLFEAAKAEINLITETDPNYEEAQLWLGNLMFQTGQELAALDLYQKSLRSLKLSDPIRHETIYQLAKLYLKLGEPEKADEQLTELERLSPNYRDVKWLKNSFKKVG